MSQLTEKQDALYQEAKAILAHAENLLIASRARMEQRQREIEATNRRNSIFPPDAKITVLEWPKL